MEQFMPLSLFVLTSVRLRFKWFVQPKLYQEISFSHAFMSSSPVKRLVAGKRLVQHGFGFECLGCWPCRTAKVASSSLAIPSKSLEQLVTLMIWKKVLTSNRILFILLWNIFRRDVTKIEHSKHFCNLCCEFMVCIHVQHCALTFKLGALTKPI